MGNISLWKASTLGALFLLQFKTSTSFGARVTQNQICQLINYPTYFYWNIRKQQWTNKMNHLPFSCPNHATYWYEWRISFYQFKNMLSTSIFTAISYLFDDCFTNMNNFYLHFYNTSYDTYFKWHYKTRYACTFSPHSIQLNNTNKITA